MVIFQQNHSLKFGYFFILVIFIIAESVTQIKRKLNELPRQILI